MEEIFHQSTFRVLEGKYVYVKVSAVPTEGEHFMITHDAAEITVITQEEQLPSLSLTDRRKELYRLVALNTSVPLYAVGFLATISQAIAEAQLNPLIIATYSKEYLLIREDGFKKALEVLKKLGFTQLH